MDPANIYLVVIEAKKPTTIVPAQEVPAVNGSALGAVQPVPGSEQLRDPEALTEIIGRAAELAFESAESPAEVAGLAVRIQQRLVSQAGQS